MTSAPVTDPGPPPPSPGPLPTRSDRFFSWSAGLGIVRGDGWIGGVCAGVAARLRIDPLIVRGIVVVIGLFGFPVLFLYAIAWAILPDLDGRIVLQHAFRGTFSPAFAGVCVFAIAGLVPAPALALIGSPGLYVWSYSSTFAVLVPLLMIVAAVAGLLIFLIVRAARRTPGVSVTELRTASAATTGPDTSAGETGSGPGLATDPPVRDSDVARDTASLAGPFSSTTDGSSDADGSSDSDGSSDTDGTEPEPARPPGGADDDALAAWRAQHAAWKEQDQLWRQQQQDAHRAAREQARRERQASATAFAAEAAERRRERRAVNPRAPFAAVAAAVGVAVIAGTVVALQQADDLAPAMGLFTAAAVLSAAMVLSGILRRRSGFLAFATCLCLVGALAGTAVPAARTLHLGSYGISNAGGTEYPASAPFVQPWGGLMVTLVDTGESGATYIRKRAGSTIVTVMPGVQVAVEVTTRSAAVLFSDPSTDTPWSDITEVPGAAAEELPDGRWRYTATISGGDDITTTERVVIDQDADYVEFSLHPAPEGDQP